MTSLAEQAGLNGGTGNGTSHIAMDRQQFISDTFASFIAGFGVWGRDKSVSMKPVLRVMQVDDLHSLYRSDWLSRKICDVPPSDATRAWRTWNADKKDVKKLEQAERQLGIQRKIEFAMQRARLLGGAAIVLGTEDGDFDTILDYKKIKKGGLKFVHVVGRYNILAGPMIKDITSPWYGHPTHYLRTNIVSTGIYEQELKPPPQISAMGKTPGSQFLIHPSRVLRFIGNEYPDMEAAPDSWGDSVLQTIYDTIRDAGLATSSVAQMIAEAKLDIIKIPGLTEILSTKEGSSKLTERFQYSNVAKSVINSIIIGGDEEWQCRQLSNVGTLDKILGMYFMLSCGAADIPATRVLGKSPDGMNSTGDSDLRNYYDRLSSDQNVRIRPLMSPLDEVLIRSVFGTRPEEIDYTWNPLWQMSESEKADIAQKKSQAFMVDVQSGMIPMTALAQARQNQLIEDDFYPGLDQALEEAEEAGDTVMEPKLPTPQGGPQAPGGPGEPGQGGPGGPGAPGGAPPGGGPGGPQGGFGGGGGGGFGQDSASYLERLHDDMDMPSLAEMRDAWEERKHRRMRGKFAKGPWEFVVNSRVRSAVDPRVRGKVLRFSPFGGQQVEVQWDNGWLEWLTRGELVKDSESEPSLDADGGIENQNMDGGETD